MMLAARGEVERPPRARPRCEAARGTFLSLGSAMFEADSC
jgi:hypothetical protein